MSTERLISVKSKSRRASRTCLQLLLERLEQRTLLAYTFTGGGTSVATATGDTSADTLYIEPFGGLLYHSTDGIVFSPDWGGGLTVAASSQYPRHLPRYRPSRALGDSRRRPWLGDCSERQDKHRRRRHQ